MGLVDEAARHRSKPDDVGRGLHAPAVDDPARASTGHDCGKTARRPAADDQDVGSRWQGTARHEGGRVSIRRQRFKDLGVGIAEAEEGFARRVERYAREDAGTGTGRVLALGVAPDRPGGQGAEGLDMSVAGNGQRPGDEDIRAGAFEGQVDRGRTGGGFLGDGERRQAARQHLEAAEGVEADVEIVTAPLV